MIWPVGSGIPEEAEADFGHDSGVTLRRPVETPGSDLVRCSTPGPDDRSQGDEPDRPVIR